MPPPDAPHPLQRRPLVLASRSPARAALLRAAGLAFTMQPADVNEAAVKQAMHASAATPDAVALALARLKAARIDAPGSMVIGADQMLACDGAWFDKPADLAAARAQLLRLRGRRHVLLTAVVCLRDGVELWCHTARPALTMRMFSDAFLDDYLALEGGHALQCVGAYRLEGPGMQLFDAVDGEHSAVLGLPMLPLLGFLRQDGLLAC